jgi:ABC-2 type transport system permease protein
VVARRGEPASRGSGLISGLSIVTDHLPGSAAGSLVGALGVDGVNAEGDGTPGVLSILDGTTQAYWLVAYLLVFALMGTILMRRNDLA